MRSVQAMIVLTSAALLLSVQVAADDSMRYMITIREAAESRDVEIQGKLPQVFPLEDSVKPDWSAAAQWYLWPLEQDHAAVERAYVDHNYWSVDHTYRSVGGIMESEWSDHCFQLVKFLQWYNGSFHADDWRAQQSVDRILKNNMAVDPSFANVLNCYDSLAEQPKMMSDWASGQPSTNGHGSSYEIGEQRVTITTLERCPECQGFPVVSGGKTVNCSFVPDSEAPYGGKYYYLVACDGKVET